MLIKSVIFICVPTPFTTTNFPIYTEDLDINNILKILRKFDRIAQKDTTDHIPVIVIKSTVPVGTIDYLAHAFPLLCIAYNPEFLRQRYSYNDALNPDRIIIGTNEQVAKDALMKLYHWIPCPIFLVDPKTAELAKLLSNAFLVTKVAFSQQIREAVNLFGIEVFPERLLTSDPRIGPSHLNSDMGKIPKDSPCLPKDMKEIMRSVPTSFFKVIFTEAIEQ